MNDELSRDARRAWTGTSRRTSATTSWKSSPACKGENSVKIFGPDLDELERLAEQVKNALAGVPGVENAGVFRIKGQSNLEFPIDREKCAAWNVSVADVRERHPDGRRRQAVHADDRGREDVRHHPALAASGCGRTSRPILDIPVDVIDNTGHRRARRRAAAATPLTGPSTGVSPDRAPARAMPALTGSQLRRRRSTSARTPRRRLGDLVTPVGRRRAGPTRTGSSSGPGRSTIYREQGSRLIAVKFSVRGRDLASAVAEAQAKVGAPDPGRRTGPSGAASSRRWRRPSGGWSWSSRCRWC